MFLSGFLGIVSTGMGISESPSVALFSLVYELFPNGLVLVVFILALVLVMSTVDTLLNATVATITIDSQKLFKNIKMESPLKFARIITVLQMIPAVLIASKGFSVLYLFFVADLICVGVFFPLFYGLFNPNLTEEVALLAAVLGVVSGIPFFIAGKLLIAFSLPVLVSVFICVIGNIAINKRLTSIMLNNIKE